MNEKKKTIHWVVGVGVEGGHVMGKGKNYCLR